MTRTDPSIPRQLEVLDPQYLPRDLYHRDGEIQQLKNTLERVLYDGSARTVTIFGPSGSGKTTLAKYIMRRFTAEAERLKLGHASCIDEKTPTRILQKLLTETGIRPTASNMSQAACLAVWKNRSDPVLLTIDDLGDLDEPAFIKSLMGTRRVGLILIGLEENEILAGLPANVRSRMQAAPTIRLQRYTNQQIEDILWGRLEQSPDLVTGPAVRTIAEWSRGSAYRAIALLRECVQTAGVGYQAIDREVVEEVSEGFHPPPQTLGTHERLLYSLIEEAGSITASALKRRYEEQSPNPRGDSMRRRYLQSLEQYGLISSTGSTRAKRYHFEGR
jgi:Cdc6-like AAA superfamily ATPase